MSPVAVRTAVSLSFAAALAALWLVPEALAVGRADHGDPGRFASEAAALHDDGWRLADLTVTHEGDGLVELALVMHKDARAVRLVVEFADWGDRVLDYHRERATPPAAGERRVYVDEDTFFAGLRGGRLERLWDQCGAPVLALAGGEEVVIGEHDWYIARADVSGAGAGAALADQLARGLARGLHLSDARALDDDAGVEFELIGDVRLLVRAETDPAGKVTRVEVREAPAMWEGGTLPREQQVGKALRRGKAVERVELTLEDGRGLVRLDVAKGKDVVIDLSTIEYPESEGCGC